MILKLHPIFLDKMWGGTKLGAMYNHESTKIGECWGISGHELYSNLVEDGKFKAKSLRELYSTNRELFGNYQNNDFPILVKYIDAMKDLSIQVHPNDKYALRYEISNGKEECWYILETKPDANIIIGHSANSKKELQNIIKNDNIIDFVNFHKVNANDYFYIPAGTVHAICEGTFLLEVSQSSDITYRLYDYKRMDNGKRRDLHIIKALDVITVPDSKVIKDHRKKYFTFEIISNFGKNTIKADQYGDYISILAGRGFVGNYQTKAGDFFMVTSNHEYHIEGELKYHLSRLVENK